MNKNPFSKRCCFLSFNFQFLKNNIFPLLKGIEFCFLFKFLFLFSYKKGMRKNSNNFCSGILKKYKTTRKTELCIKSLYIFYSFSFVMFTLNSSTNIKRWLHNIHVYIRSQTFLLFSSFTTLERKVAKDDTDDGDDGNEPSLFCYIIHLVFGRSQLSQMPLSQNNLAHRRHVCLQNMRIIWYHVFSSSYIKRNCNTIWIYFLKFIVLQSVSQDYF